MSFVVGMAVLSHFVLDLLTHDALLLAPGLQTTIGLGLGNFVIPTILLEMTMLVAAVGWYWIKARSSLLEDVALFGLTAVMAAPFLSLLGNPSPAEQLVGLSIGLLSVFLDLAAPLTGTEIMADLGLGSQQSCLLA